jgi:hypothetical protein
MFLLEFRYCIHSILLKIKTLEIELSSQSNYCLFVGAVPLVTLNLQKAVPPGWVTPDAWHHQMVYGVGPKGERHRINININIHREI